MILLGIFLIILISLCIIGAGLITLSNRALKKELERDEQKEKARLQALWDSSKITEAELDEKYPAWHSEVRPFDANWMDRVEFAPKPSPKVKAGNSMKMSSLLMPRKTDTQRLIDRIQALEDAINCKSRKKRKK